MGFISGFAICHAWRQGHGLILHCKCRTLVPRRYSLDKMDLADIQAVDLDGLNVEQLREFALQFYEEDKLQRLLEEATQYFPIFEPDETDWLAAHHVAEEAVRLAEMAHEDEEAALRPATPRAGDRAGRCFLD